MSELDALHKRLDRLEREVRWWRIAGGLSIGFLSLILLIGATAIKTRDEITAKRVVIVDGKGKPRITLGEVKYPTVSNESFGLMLTRPDGVVGVDLYLGMVSATGAHSMLGLYDGRGDRHASLGLVSDQDSDYAALVLAGEMRPFTPEPMVLKTGREKITIEVDSRRGAQVLPGLSSSTASMTLRTGQVGTGFWLDGKQAGLSFDNYEGSPPVGVIASQKGGLWFGLAADGPALTLGDSILGPRLVAGHVSLEKSGTGVVEQRPASSLVLFDKDGKVIWKAP